VSAQQGRNFTIDKAAYLKDQSSLPYLAQDLTDSERASHEADKPSEVRLWIEEEVNIPE
jgi:hypothetical protein